MEVIGAFDVEIRAEPVPGTRFADWVGIAVARRVRGDGAPNLAVLPARARSKPEAERASEAVRSWIARVDGPCLLE